MTQLDHAERLALQRSKMVAEQLEARGITDTAVLNAMCMVPRDYFVLPAFQPLAYDDTPLPILAGQTISQPYIVAYMLSALQLKPADRVLEIGTGSGYEAAVLSHLVKEVYTVERIGRLARYAQRRLERLGYDNVHVHCADGTVGWPQHAPYDAIIVSAGGPYVPPSLVQQLVVNGRLVMPIGRDPFHQMLIRYTRESDEALVGERLGPAAFVPLIGHEGWSGTEERQAQNAKRQLKETES